MKEHGLRSHVATCVFFSNDDIVLRIKGETDIYSDCPFFEISDESRFYDYFRSENYRRYSDEEVQKILRLLDQLAEEPSGAL